MTTYAPQRLLDVRHYLQSQTGLPDNELGIVGDASHTGGYHQGWSMRRITNGLTQDYSWNESLRDSNHRTEAASAFDIGSFPRLRDLSLWLVSECEKGSADTLDIREVIYSPDGKTVKRWDRLGYRTSGDDSHLTHTHVSYFRDAEDRDKVGLYQRFFGGTVNLDEQVLAASWRLHTLLWGLTEVPDDPNVPESIRGNPNRVQTNMDAIREAIASLPERVHVGTVDPVAIAQALAAQPDFYPKLGEVLADKLIAKLRGE